MPCRVLLQCCQLAHSKRPTAWHHHHQLVLHKHPACSDALHEISLFGHPCERCSSRIALLLLPKKVPTPQRLAASLQAWLLL